MPERSTRAAFPSVLQRLAVPAADVCTDGSCAPAADREDGRESTGPGPDRALPQHDPRGAATA